jgi:hypothetical protein
MEIQLVCAIIFQQFHLKLLDPVPSAVCMFTLEHQLLDNLLACTFLEYTTLSGNSGTH